MKKKIIATNEERARMDEIDAKQQDAIEMIGRRVEHLVWVICVLSVIWGGVVILILTGKK